MDIKTHFELLNPTNKVSIGWKEKNGDSIFVPIYGEIENFVDLYNVLDNYDMGWTVIVYDKEKEKADHFAMLFAFRKVNEKTYPYYNEYRVEEMLLDNLDLLQILNQRKKLNVDQH